jgi:hypothetical protein
MMQTDITYTLKDVLTYIVKKITGMKKNIEWIHSMFFFIPGGRCLC